MDMTSNRFRSYIKNNPPQLPSLPLTHMTISKTFRQIIDSIKPELQTKDCKVFKGESLLYFFYGRPAYRINSNGEAFSIPADLPVCFLFKPDCLSNYKRIYPFDSGAFFAGLYNLKKDAKELDDFSLEPDKLKELDDFSLEPDQSTPPYVVAAFFGSNKNYYLNQVKKSLDDTFDELDFESIYYYALNSIKLPTPFDDRRGTIEIQSDNPINIAVDNLLAVVLPVKFTKDSEITDFVFNKCKAKILHYYACHCSPVEYIGEIRREVMRFLEEKGYL
jgi:hypothetical protein